MASTALSRTTAAEPRNTCIRSRRDDAAHASVTEEQEERGI